MEKACIINVLLDGYFMRWTYLSKISIQTKMQNFICTPRCHSFVPFQGFPCGSAGKDPPAMRETWVQSLGWEDPLEKGKATHSSVLAWRIPWTGRIHWGRQGSDTTEPLSPALSVFSFFFFFFIFFYFFIFYFLFVVDFVIHWNETAKGLHVFPIPIPPPTSLSTHSL